MLLTQARNGFYEAQLLNSRYYLLELMEITHINDKITGS
jgi:hypothetical protein